MEEDLQNVSEPVEQEAKSINLSVSLEIAKTLDFLMKEYEKLN